MNKTPCGACGSCGKSCGCKKVFNDDFILALMAEIALAATSTGGPEAAAAYVDKFCEDSCTQGNLSTPTCGKDAILTEILVGFQGFLKTLVFYNFGITRVVNPDCSVTVSVLRNADYTTNEDPDTVVKTYGVEQIVFDKSCCIKFEAFVDILVAPPPAPPV